MWIKETNGRRWKMFSQECPVVADVFIPLPPSALLLPLHQQLTLSSSPSSSEQVLLYSLSILSLHLSHRLTVKASCPMHLESFPWTLKGVHLNLDHVIKSFLISLYSSSSSLSRSHLSSFILFPHPLSLSFFGEVLGKFFRYLSTAPVICTLIN